MPGRCPVANGRRGQIDLVPSPGGVLLVITQRDGGHLLGFQHIAWLEIK